MAFGLAHDRLGSRDHRQPARLEDELRAAFGSHECRAADRAAHPLRQPLRGDACAQGVAFQLQTIGGEDREEMPRILLLRHRGRVQRPLLGERRLRHDTRDVQLAFEHVGGRPLHMQQAASVFGARLRPPREIVARHGDGAGIGGHRERDLQPGAIVRVREDAALKTQHALRAAHEHLRMRLPAARLRGLLHAGRGQLDRDLASLARE